MSSSEESAGRVPYRIESVAPDTLLCYKRCAHTNFRAATANRGFSFSD
jgi:hypothetical protein